MSEQEQQDNGAVKPPTEYLVEIRDTDADSLVFWRGAGSVIVPARTSRKKALEKAVEELPILQRAVTDGEAVVRLLAADDVYEQPVGYKQPPPELVIGGAA